MPPRQSRITPIEELERTRLGISLKLRAIQERLDQHPEQVLSNVRVQTFMEKIDEYIDKNEEIFDQLNACTEEALLEQNSIEFNRLNDLLLDTKERVYALLPATPPTITANQPNQIIIPDVNHNELRLPAIDIPKFSGNIRGWESFNDLFTTLVINRNIPNVQKLQYLKTALTGEASRLIQSIAVTNDNFERAWSIIQGRYDNKRVIINSHFYALTHQDTIKTESAAAIRKLLDNTVECVQSIEARSDIPDKWDYMLMYLTIEKLDPETKKQWELSITTNAIPTFAQLKEFLETRARSLNAAGNSNQKANTSHNNNGNNTNGNNTKEKPKTQVQKVHVAKKSRLECPKCKGDHYLSKCDDFKKLSVVERLKVVREKSLCHVCFGSTHNTKDCTRGWICTKCPEGATNASLHNTLLHFGRSDHTKNNNNNDVAKVHHSNIKSDQTLLATALVNVYDGNGELQTCRALLDQGSQASLITQRCLKRLDLPRMRSNANVTGIGDANTKKALGMALLSVASKVHNYEFSMHAYVLPVITGIIPSCQVYSHDWPHILGLELADPNFYIPGEIDILIGADYVGTLLNGGIIHGEFGSPTAQDTKLGWILSGLAGARTDNVRIHAMSCEIHDMMNKFWEIEDLPSDYQTKSLTGEEQACEQHFESTYSRDENGRFIVELPFKNNHLKLGKSKETAIKMWNTTEKRISKSPEVYKQYQACIQEYLNNGHMEVVPECEHDNENCYYIPHHAVIKQSSNTTKCRVVLNASAKSSNGLSLNDILMVGPKLQDDLITLLMRFGIYTEPMVADIAKMYLQFWVHPKHRDYQRLVWRPTLDSPLVILRGTVVMFGIASSSYLAIKCTQKLAELEALRFPLAAMAIKHDLYVDNLFTGANDEKSALELQEQILGIMEAGGMVMRQWSAHNPNLLSSLPENLRETQIPFEFDSDISIKTLGIFWNPIKDVYHFKYNVDNSNSLLTRRLLLSHIARQYDPPGWLEPIKILAKIFLQESYANKMGWDEPLSQTLQDQWDVYKRELPLIEKLEIPRCITSTNAIYYELYGFSDASEKAYAAVIYLRQINRFENNKVSLILSKSRVTPPNKKNFTIPKKELCGALLLARCLKLVLKSLHLQIKSVHAFVDSTIVLAWINSDPNKWKIFVSNRVKEIQSVLAPEFWHHVPGVENPADIASRGLFPSELENHSLWWQGPSWLCDNDYSPPIGDAIVSGSHDVWPEQRPLRVLTVSKFSKKEKKEQEKRERKTIFSRFSSLSTLLRVESWRLRFIYNCNPNNKFNKRTGALSVSEINNALNSLIIIVQNDEFNEEIELIRNRKPVHLNSQLATLNPFLKDGILRVGGRLSNAPLPEDQKFPILLPKYHLFTDLIIADVHERGLHAGPQQMMATIQQNYWIIGLRGLVRQHVKSCITCARVSATLGRQLMADLPATRVTPDLAFQRVGIDYAGPINILTLRSKRSLTKKAYIVIFACFTTRAIHLECASDLSTKTFIQTFERFVSRRGKPRHVHSDNGCNLVRADKEFKQTIINISSHLREEEMTNYLLNNNIEWHFNPHSGPNFGALWELGIKSVKYHWRRVVKNAKVTYEEMNTLLCKIEAGLNSRPLTPLSSDPLDLQVLTPGHFLIGRPLNALPEPDLRAKPINLLSRWQYLSKLFQHFWQRWSKEYLTRLQQRSTWLREQRSLAIGDMVLIKVDNHPSLEWPLGRVIQIHLGKDGKVRVVTVKTATKELTRPITKLALLPIDNKES